VVVQRRLPSKTRSNKARSSKCEGSIAAQEWLDTWILLLHSTNKKGGVGVTTAYRQEAKTRTNETFKQIAGQNGMK
jgi:hypothetical protein